MTLAEFVKEEALSKIKYHYSPEDMTRMFLVDFDTNFPTKASKATAISSLDLYSKEVLLSPFGGHVLSKQLALVI